MNEPGSMTLVQFEALHCLQEELAEAIVAVAKVLRHGYASHDPTEGGGSLSNREALEMELGDVQFWIKHLVEGGDLSATEILGWQQTKGERTKPYLHFVRLP